MVWIVHNLRYCPEYKVYAGMKQRCYNPKAKSYKRYGARGIRVCDRWLENFKFFYEDMGPSPSKGYDLSRLDTNGNYEKDNCEWQAHATNMKNLRPRSKK